MKGVAHPFPFAALSFPDSKKVPIYCWIVDSLPVISCPSLGFKPRTSLCNQRQNCLLNWDKDGSRQTVKVAILQI